MLISCENMSFGFQGDTLLERVTFSLNETDRVGLIGGNGEGKTTLIRLILGELEAESGEIFRKNHFFRCKNRKAGKKTKNDKFHISSLSNGQAPLPHFSIQER